MIQGTIDRRKVAAVTAFKRALAGVAELDGHLFLGFPIVEVRGVTTAVDALLVSQVYGLIVFDFHIESALDTEALRLRQDDIYINLKNRFIQRDRLRSDRDRLKFRLRLMTYAPFLGEKVSPTDGSFEICGKHVELSQLLQTLPELLESEIAKEIVAVIQAVDRIRPRSPRNVARPETKGAILAYINSQISNLDSFQNKAIVETTDSPQRIRGLAGCGKTVVLASKAAYLHASPANSEAVIAVTYYTRALYGHLRSLITRFYQAYTNSLDEPDWSRLRLLHAWGSHSDPGIYSEIARVNDKRIYDYRAARQSFGEKAFAGACDELLRSTEGYEFRVVFDFVIIDEAQDLPRAFFELAYKACSDPKRVVWAYDELQKLDSEETMPPPEVLFGKDSMNRPLVTLRNEVESPDQDIVLPVCYRNPREILVTAHALGFGIYRSDGGLIQMMTDRDLWNDIGYSFDEGSPEPGVHVRLKRAPAASPTFLSEHAGGTSSIVEAIAFQDYEAQALWIAKSIKLNIEQDDLQTTDILVIHPEPATIKSASRLLQMRLTEIGVASHIAGAGYDRDQFFVPNSIAISHIFRAKGNEAAIVYMMDSHYCARGHELIKKRNILFTAVTRARAWVRLCGVGGDMDLLVKEVQAVRDQGFTLAFPWPGPSELMKMRMLHRELTPEEKRSRERGSRSASELVDLVNSGSLHLDEIPTETIEQLRKMFGGK